MMAHGAFFQATHNVEMTQHLLFDAFTRVSGGCFVVKLPQNSWGE
jgi:hypothetical protein